MSDTNPPFCSSAQRNSSDEPYCLTAVLDAALWWGQLVPLVPLAPGLSDGPRPLIRWKEDGPFRTESRVRGFWARHPEAQLAIVLGPTSDGRFLGAIDTDLKKRRDGMPEPPAGFEGGYRHSTKSKGTHDPFFYRVAPPESVPRRAIGVGGFVDVLLDGLLIVPPTRFDGAGEYGVVRRGPIPEFEAVGHALEQAAPWLREAWRSRRTPAAAGVQLDPGGRIPHAQHHDFIVQTAASLASRIAGVSEADLLRWLRAVVRETLDDADSHEREIADAVRSAVAKFGRPPDPEPTPGRRHERTDAVRDVLGRAP